MIWETICKAVGLALPDNKVEGDEENVYASLRFKSKVLFSLLKLLTN